MLLFSIPSSFQSIYFYSSILKPVFFKPDLSYFIVIVAFTNILLSLIFFSTFPCHTYYLSLPVKTTVQRTVKYWWLAKARVQEGIHLSMCRRNHTIEGSQNNNGQNVCFVLLKQRHCCVSYSHFHGDTWGANIAVTRCENFNVLFPNNAPVTITQRWIWRDE